MLIDRRALYGFSRDTKIVLNLRLQDSENMLELKTANFIFLINIYNFLFSIHVYVKLCMLNVCISIWIFIVANYRLKAR